eukprot:jgi/Psemu1/27591/gm1.27591_g
MITFLPSTDFDEVARCLDDKRLGAQRYEAWSILKWLRNPSEYPKLVRAGYCVMWAGHEDALVRYTNAMLNEWAARGKKNDLLRPYDKERKLDEPNAKSKSKAAAAAAAATNVKMPPWLGAEALHSYHRHALVSKFPEHYKKFGWSEDGSAYNGSYLWPVPMEEDCNHENGRQEHWVLRWPKSKKLPPIPIATATATATSANGATSSISVATTRRQKESSIVGTEAEIKRNNKIRRLTDETTTTNGVDHRKRRRTMRLRSGRQV